MGATDDLACLPTKAAPYNSRHFQRLIPTAWSPRSPWVLFTRKGTANGNL